MKEDIKIFNLTQIKAMNISMAGISYCDGSYHIYRAKSDVTVIEYILEGEGYVTVNGTDCPVTKDKIYILKQGREHNYYSCSNNPWQKVFINLSGTLPVQLCEEYGFSNEWIFDGLRLRPIFEKIISLVHSDIPDSECISQLSGVFVEILSSLSLSRETIGHSKEAVTLKDFLDANTHRIVSNAELAKHIYRSTDYCVKLFGREYSVTPYEYQINQKIKIACRLLRDTVLPISSVAATVGYNDSRYFSGLFKKRRGISPREYRKQENLHY